MLRIGELFDEEPDKWGLRGDRQLWQELQRKLGEEPAPKDKRQLERLLENAFWEETGHSLAFCNEVLVDRFADVGTSRGGISGETWRYRLFPLIIRRFEAIRKREEDAKPQTV